MMFINNLGAGEIVVIFMVALLVFGPQKLPELGRSLGRGIREFRKGTSGLMDSLREADQASTAEPAAKPAAEPRIEASQKAPATVEEKKPEKMVIDLEQEGK